MTAGRRDDRQNLRPKLRPTPAYGCGPSGVMP